MLISFDFKFPRVIVMLRYSVDLVGVIRFQIFPFLKFSVGLIDCFGDILVIIVLIFQVFVCEMCVYNIEYKTY